MNTCEDCRFRLPVYPTETGRRTIWDAKTMTHCTQPRDGFTRPQQWGKPIRTPCVFTPSRYEPLTPSREPRYDDAA